MFKKFLFIYAKHYGLPEPTPVTVTGYLWPLRFT
jgi:hypothetical protein